MYYFKRHWNETTGEKLTENWGLSTYYFETDDKFEVTRQLQLFNNGKVLKYSNEYTDDKFGALSEQSIQIDECIEFSITKDEFDQLWEESFYKQFPEIVCTNHTLWGQPRIDGTRLAVGDIISLADIYKDDMSVFLKDFDLTLQQVKQALHYCKLLECKKDKPEKYCHNCLLRIEQFNETIDEEDPEKPNWLRADNLFEQFFKTTKG